MKKLTSLKEYLLQSLLSSPEIQMYRTIAQLDAAIDALVSSQPTICTKFALNNSVEGRPIFALRLRAGGATDRRGVLMIGGMHARELMNPDAIIELAVDLVNAYVTNTGLAYGGALCTPRMSRP